MDKIRQIKAPNGLQEENLYILKKGELLRVKLNSKSPIPRPDKSIYGSAVGNVEGNMIGDGLKTFKFLHWEYPKEGGIHAYREGELFPLKGAPTPEAVYAVDIVKRNSMMLMRVIVKNPLLLLSLFVRKWRNNMIARFVKAYEIVLNPFCFNEEYPRYFKKAVKQIILFVDTFCEEFGILYETRTARIVGMVFEYDDAYLNRLQDLANETTVEKLLKNPRKEIQRLYEIFCERESRAGLKDKLGVSVRLIRGALLFPKTKRAFRTALEAIDFSQLQMDEGDKYHVLQWNKYKFLGMEDEERHKKFIKMHNGKLPPQYIVTTK